MTRTAKNSLLISYLVDSYIVVELYNQKGGINISAYSLAYKLATSIATKLN